MRKTACFGDFLEALRAVYAKNYLFWGFSWSIQSSLCEKSPVLGILLKYSKQFMRKITCFGDFIKKIKWLIISTTGLAGGLLCPFPKAKVCRMFYLLVVNFLHTPLSFSHFYPRYQQNTLYTKNIIWRYFNQHMNMIFLPFYTLVQKQYGTYNFNSYVINCLCS